MSLDEEREDARRAIQQMHRNSETLVDHEERLATLERAVLQLPERIAQALADKIDEKATDPHMWAKVRTAWRDQAVRSAGEFVVGGIGAAAKRVAGWLVVALIVWQLAGFSGLSHWASSAARAAITNWLNRANP